MGNSMPFGNQRWNIGVLDIGRQPFEILAHELMKCQNDLPSTTAWLIVQPMKMMSATSVTWTASSGCDIPS